MAFREGGQVAGVIVKGTNVGGEAVAGKVAGVVIKDTNVSRDRRDGGKVVKVAIIAGSGHRRKVGLVCQAVVVAVKAGGQFHEAAARKVDGVIADAQDLAFREGGKVASVVGKATHVGGEGVAGKVAGVIVKDTNVCREGVASKVAGIIVKDTNVSRDRRDSGLVGEIIIVA